MMNYLLTALSYMFTMYLILSNEHIEEDDVEGLSLRRVILNFLKKYSEENDYE